MFSSGRGLALSLLILSLSACTFMNPPDAYLPSYSSIRPGKTVVVKGNENIYVIAHKNNVSMREIIVLNYLKPPFEVKRGQKLVLPAGGSTFTGDIEPPDASPLDPVEKKELSPLMPASVSSQELEPPPTTNLRTRSQSGVGTVSAQEENRSAAAQKQSVVEEPDSDSDVAAAPSADVSTSMRWPVQGPILSSFGSKGAGMKNDGVNIGAPKGAPVVAAASGTVVYAGNDMKGFGNMVLIKHQGDVVTAYAHLARVLVKKGKPIAQGGMIGTVGKTGNVATPQLHFEIRIDGKAVDPVPYIKNAS
jgi:murein DD-endopeptidase MepM/ murein hydrolase activator NlpD